MTAPAVPRIVAARCTNSPTGPCHWPVDMACCDCLDLSTVSEELIASRLDLAAELVWMYSGRRFGLCDIQVRPCSRRCMPAPAFPGPPTPMPFMSGGNWFNASCGCPSRDACSCGPMSEICLPGPVAAINWVSINGQVLDADQYRVDGYKWLVRTDRGQWPPCQFMDSAIDEDGSFVVDYARGTPVPAGGAWAAGIMACELLKDCIGDRTCRLPRNIAHVNRQGVTVDFVAAATAQNHYKTGIEEIDLWLNAVNPDELRSHSDVWSPDLCANPRRTTWPR